MSEQTVKTPKTNQKKKTKKAKVKVFTKKKQKDPENVLIEKLQARYENVESVEINTFSDLPLSSKTLKGLRECGYNKPTAIQKQTIGLSLQGKDILGAAQTGSGKTLAFLIPILECLYCHQWTRLDGLGALVITPTRELAYQIFEELRRIGEHQDFSAGLIIGGKDLKFERNRMDQCNIVICTPGRLLQHMDENPLFDCVNMKILVLDEADRCLDMGFERTMNAIIANLPPTRQTLLFSATQTKSVRDLARLSLKDPSYISVHENSEFSTPKELQQTYVTCELKDKIAILWSFIKNHLKQKIIIFLSSCKQVKYLHEIFSKLRPGSSLMALYGSLHQLRRMEIYENFCKKSAAVLFATDLASRGLDFPEVHWVVQADCPEDVATYIHRVGRTARYHRGGESLLLLLESEMAMVQKLEEKKIPITNTEINPLKLNNPVRKVEAYLVTNSKLKDTAHRAFLSYVKAVHLMKDKQIFDVHSLDTDGYAHSLGISMPPRIRFLQRMNARAAGSSIKQKNPSNNKKYFNDDDEEDEEKNSNDSEEYTEHIKESLTSFNIFNENSDAQGDILQVNSRNLVTDLPTTEEINETLSSNKSSNNAARNNKPLTKAALAKKMLKNDVVPNKKTVFDDDGDVLTNGNIQKKSELAQQYNEDSDDGIRLENTKLVITEEDKYDKQLFREKNKAKKKEKKRKLKEQLKKDEEGEGGDEEEASEDSEGELPDMSWLPDPDKIYGKSQDEESGNETQKKRKKGNMDDLETVIKKKKKHNFKQLSEGLSVNDAEELALMLLRK